jgi:uncharacterized protein (DUF1499 family)
MKSAIGIIAAGAGTVSITLFVLGFALGYARLVPSHIAFLFAALGMALGLIATIAGVVLLARQGMSPRAGLALLGLPPALMLLYTVINTRGLPVINDISTDLVYPPALHHAATVPANAGRDMSLPESFKDDIKDAYPDLQSLGMNKRRDDVFAKALDIARRHPGWTVTSSTVTASESIIEGEAQSRLFGFVDDWTVRITDAQGGGVVVDMRSKSRVGKGDLGANAARIRDFLKQLQA